MDDGWGISIDVEGFSNNYEFNEERKTYAIRALGELMSAIYRIGSLCFPGTPEKNFSERLFAHQFGDGFLICPDFAEPDGLRAIAIATALMRHMTLNGYVAKAAIATGELSGIKGCYPQPMRDSENDRTDMGMGLMTTIPIMGTALTKAYKLGRTARGAVLIVDREILEQSTPSGAFVSGHGSKCIDWISSKNPLADEIAANTKLSTASPAKIISKLKEYCSTVPKPPSKWVEDTFSAVDAINEA